MIPKIYRRAALLLGGAAFLFAAGCQTSSRINGAITIVDGFQAPDSDRHTLYVAAFPSGSVVGGTLDTAAIPVFVEFGGISNGDFDPRVTYALGGGGDAQEVDVLVWWKVNRPELPDYVGPEEGDRFGVYAMNPIFRGEDGTKGGAQAHGVDLVIDQTYVRRPRIPVPRF